jgi:glutathione S-transferase
MNPKGKIPLFRHNDIFISESVASMNYVANNFEKPSDFYIPSSPKEKSKVDEWCYFCAMELDALGIYILRRHEQVENRGLANLYGEAPNAIKTAKEHFSRMIKACERDVPNENWLMGNSPCCADIMFMSCLQVATLFNIEIKSKNIVSYYERAIQRQHYINAMIETFGQEDAPKK